MKGYFSKETLNQSAELTGKWEEEVRRSAGTAADHKARWSTVSDLEINRLYTPEDIAQMDFARDIGVPGEFPFLRGNQATGYRGRTWTFRMFAGMGSAKDTNARWHMLLKEGQTGLSTAFDFPTLMGYDSDSPKARGECGRCGVAIDTLDDFLTLMEGIPMDKQLAGAGGVLSFEVEGSGEDACRAAEALNLFTLAPSLGGVDSLVTIPVLTSHAMIDPELREKMGVTEQMIRLSVGIENVEDLIADLEKGLAVLSRKQEQVGVVG